jgi:hypothetical protein
MVHRTDGLESQTIQSGTAIGLAEACITKSSFLCAARRFLPGRRAASQPGGPRKTGDCSGLTGLRRGRAVLLRLLRSLWSLYILAQGAVGFGGAGGVACQPALDQRQRSAEPTSPAETGFCSI